MFTYSGCLKCSQFKDENMEEEVSQQTPDFDQTKKCIRCQQVKHERNDFRVNKRHPSKRIDICKACEIQKPKVKSQRDLTKPWTPIAQSEQLNPNIVSVDFSEYPDIFAHLKKAALNSFRTESQYLLHLVNKDMNPV